MEDHEHIRHIADEAQAASRRGAHGLAVERYRELVALLPHAACFNNLGLALMRDARLEDAVAAFASSIAREESVAAWVNLGNAHRSSGRKPEALAAYEHALALDSNAAAAHFNMHAALYEQASPEPAVRALERALALRPEHFDTRFYLGALRSLHGGHRELVAALPEVCAFLVSSLAYVETHRRDDTRLFADTFDTLRHAFEQATNEGAIVELGVRRGTTLRFLAELAGSDRVHGFDAFEGLPEAWGEQARGLYTTGGELPEVPSHVTLHPGWFAQTLPAFAETLRTGLRFVHVDCDLYSSTKQAFDALSPHLVPGTVVVLDDYLCNPDWERGEHRALVELGRPYDYLAFSLFTKQATVRIRA